jgi:photosystem II stability/assembly factor-like uncharacterized protein
MVAARLLVGFTVVVVACSGAPPGPLPERALPWGEAQFDFVPIGREASLRAMAPVDRTTAWVGGSGGTLVHTVDGGRTWQDVAPPDCSQCDFRDLHAVDGNVALAMVAGQPARLYRTEDAGRTWRVVVADARPAAFFDAISLAGGRGLLFADPIDGAFVVFTTVDDGRTWSPVPAQRLPPPMPGEAAFAASGTCVEAGPDGVLRIATGGAAARVLASHDGGSSWRATPLPLVHGAASQGAFSIACRADGVGVVVGGDYLAPAATVGTAARTMDGGRTWQPAADGLRGYRSAVLWLAADAVLAAGPGGVDLSRDGGRHWRRLRDEGFHALARGGDGSVWACGAGGRVARLELPPARP